MPVYATRRGLELECYFEPSQRAPLGSEFFTRLNYEGYFFCNAEERARFEADPIAFCGLLTDPVSKLRFRPQAHAARVSHEGVLYFFEAEQTARIFKRAPGDYMLPGYKMEEDLPSASAPTGA